MRWRRGRDKAGDPSSSSAEAAAGVSDARASRFGASGNCSPAAANRRCPFKSGRRLRRTGRTPVSAHRISTHLTRGIPLYRAHNRRPPVIPEYDGIDRLQRACSLPSTEGDTFAAYRRAKSNIIEQLIAVNQRRVTNFLAGLNMHHRWHLETLIRAPFLFIGQRTLTVGILPTQ
jgi:hypothetical protein